jgi:MFS family permease
MSTLAPVELRPGLTRGQWLVLTAAMLGWLFDGYELGLFPVIARPALQDLLGASGGDAQVGFWVGWITASFLIGAALGGIAFGWLGDRIGRVRAMALSILTYSLVTGIGYFVHTPAQLGAVRAVSALGMGGQWALGVALVMECWPEKWRPLLAGVMGAASNVGILFVGIVARAFPVTPHSWRWMLLVAALPSLLVIFVIAFTPESDRWRAAAKKSAQTPLREVFGPVLRSRTLLGIAFASVALIGTWGSVQWLPVWADKMAGPGHYSAKADTHMLSAFGAILGSLIAPFVGARFGRRPAYFFLCLLSFGLCAVLFRTVTVFGPTFLIFAFLVGGATASFYGWFPLYLPELFPTRVRATAQGTCFNSGRILAAVGAVTQGSLVGYFGGSYARAGAVVTLVYLLGMGLIWLAPETKGNLLPE